MPTDAQRTIGATTKLDGVGLFHGRSVAVTLRPGEPGSGIVFARSDLSGAPTARVCVENLADGDRCSAIRVGDGEVRLVEHILAAIGGLGVDNLLVEVNGEEMPCLDGSALPWAKALTKAGLVEQNRSRNTIVVSREIEVRTAQSRLLALPASDGLCIRYTLDYGGRFLSRQSFELKLSEEAFVRELAPARTYVLRPEIEELLGRGLGGGATPENVIVVEEDGTIATKLRFPDECARHKALDLLGDLQWIGGRLVAGVMGVGSGHALNRQLVRAILRASDGSAARPETTVKNGEVAGWR